jgi:hypothetical protein
MALTCTLPGLAAVIPGSLNNFSSKEKQAALVFYLFRRKNPDTTTLNVTTLMSQSKCLECAPSESMLQTFEVWIAKQAATDAGASLGTFSASDLKAAMKCLLCLSFHELRAMEIFLRCQLD